MTTVWNAFRECSCAMVHLTRDRNEPQMRPHRLKCVAPKKADPWVFLCRGLDEPVRERERRRCGAAGDVELVEDIADMSRDGLLAESEVVSDGPVRSAGRNQTEELKLTGGQPCRRTRCRASRPQTGEIQLRSEVLKRLARRCQLDISAVPVVELATRLRNHHLRARSLVRYVQLSPERPGRPACRE